ncbi:unnamed protein product [Fasciola hepatica]|uniref:Uncharacterized protein n=1 Tax=Fasciola hepatica TaxID=6192 RepID=A0ABC9HJE3_FASHE
MIDQCALAQSDSVLHVLNIMDIFHCPTVDTFTPVHFGKLLPFSTSNILLKITDNLVCTIVAADENNLAANDPDVDDGAHANLDETDDIDDEADVNDEDKHDADGYRYDHDDDHEDGDQDNDDDSSDYHEDDPDVDGAGDNDEHDGDFDDGEKDEYDDY